MNSRDSKRVCLNILFIATVAFCTSHAQAETITISTADGDGADAQLRGLIGTDDQSGDNFGSFSNLAYRLARVSTAGIDRFQKSIIRFDLPDNIDTITSATLRLFSTTAFAKDYDLQGLNEMSDYGPGQLDETWSENTITWDNAPMHDGIGNDSNSQAAGTIELIVNGGTTPASPGTESISNAALLSFLNSDTNGLVSFVIRADDNEASLGGFASKEHDGSGFTGLHAPELVLEYTVVPEPSTFVLGGLGFGLLLLRLFWRLGTL